jgi:hypothetical protein
VSLNDGCFINPSLFVALFSLSSTSSSQDYATVLNQINALNMDHLSFHCFRLEQTGYLVRSLTVDMAYHPISSPDNSLNGLDYSLLQVSDLVII